MNRTRRKQLRNWLLAEARRLDVEGDLARTHRAYIATAWIAHLDLKWYDLNRNVVRTLISNETPPPGWPQIVEEAGDRFRVHTDLGRVLTWVYVRILSIRHPWMTKGPR